MKKRKSNRFLSVILVLLTVCLAACSPSGKTEIPSVPAETDGNGNEPVQQTGTVLADANGTSYRIVYPLEATDTLRSAAISVRNRIQSVTGTTVPVGNDMDPETECEILLGDVSRMARLQLSSELKLGTSDFAIALREEKVVILGGSVEATQKAVEYFLQITLLTDSAQKKVSIPHQYIHESRAEGNGIMILTGRDENHVFFTLNPESGAEICCRLGYTGNHGWRLLTHSPEENNFSELGASQQLSVFLNEDPVQISEPIAFEQTETGAVLRAGDGSRAELTCEPFLLEFYSPSGKLVASVTDISRTVGGTGMTGKLERGEAIFGTGERFNTANQRGKKMDLYALDEWNVIGGNGYMPIPLLVSSRGSGIFINRYEPMTVDLGYTDSDLWHVDLQKAAMDCYFFASDLIPDVLYGYSTLSGFADMPEDWMFGVLVCRYSPDFATKEGIYEMIRNMEENDLPWTAVILEGWSIYDQTTYKDLKEVVDYVHSLGKKVMAYCTMGVVYTQWLSLPDDSYLVHLALNGSNKIPTVSAGVQNPDASASSTRYYLDLTNQAACKWFFDEIWGHLVYDIGLDGAKIDFCELFPESVELKLANGSTPGAHHWYPTYFNSLFYSMMKAKPDGGMNFSRGGGIGSQRNPFMWAGDQTREFSRLHAALSAVLSSGLSGVPFMTYDMAGYRPSSQSGMKDDEAAVFIRGIQMTAFTSCIQTHGTVTRPYDFDQATVAIYRVYTKLHEILTPYIREYAEAATKTGMPLVRHLVLQYQNDQNVYQIDDEFMLGDGLLVAPVLDGSLSRNVYLPQGRWKNLFSGEIYEVGEGGMRLTDVSVPMEQIPVYVNMDHTSETLNSVLKLAEELLGSLRG